MSQLSAEQWLARQAKVRGGLFISGTDTGIGKTWVASRLCMAWREQGLDVGVFKPAESGNGGDAERLRRVSACGDALQEIRPFAWKQALAPAMAARLEGKPFSLPQALVMWKRLRARHNMMIVEGAGGLLVPLNQRVNVADLAAALKLPLLIVARAGLGTLNHSLLTVEAARRRRLNVAAIVLNGAIKGNKLAKRNVIELRRLTKLAVIGPVLKGAKSLGWAPR